MSNITESEKNFCNLYVYGGAMYAYKAHTSYMSAMEGKSDNAVMDTMQEPIKLAKAIRNGKTLLKKAHIKEYIKELLTDDDADFRKKATKEMMIDVLGNVFIEASTTTYKDEDGNDVIPANLRTVAVQAGKLLTELVPVKEDDSNNKGSANITISITPTEGSIKTDE